MFLPSSIDLDTGIKVTLQGSVQAEFQTFILFSPIILFASQVH